MSLESLGYVLGALGIVTAVAAILIAIRAERKKPKRVVVRWREPARFRHALAGVTSSGPNPWLLMLLLGGIMGVLLIRAWLLEQPVDGSWPLTLGMAGAFVLGGGLVYGFLFPWMNSKIPRWVRVFDKGVYVGGIQVGFVAWALYPWEQVASAMLANVKIGQEVFPALVLYLRGGQRVSVGLSQTLPGTEVAAAVGTRSRTEQ